MQIDGVYQSKMPCPDVMSERLIYDELSPARLGGSEPPASSLKLSVNLQPRLRQVMTGSS